MTVKKMWMDKALKHVADLNQQNKDLAIKSGGVTLYTQDQVVYAFSRFFSYCWYDLDDTNDDIWSLYHLWTAYLSSNLSQITKIFDALQLTYDPIENYNMTEETAEGHGVDSTEASPDGEMTTTTTADQTGFDSVGDGVQTDKTTVTTSYDDAKSTTDPKNTLQLYFDGVTYQDQSYHDVSRRLFKRSGNIGVQTAADMLQKEYEVRQIDLLQDTVKRFVDLYMWMVM